MGQIFAVMASCLVLAVLSGCASPPALPDETDLPVRKIMDNTICELRYSFLDLSDKNTYPSFKADEWAMSISITPKVDTQYDVNVGANGTSTLSKASTKFFTWTLGTSPGAQIDQKGHSDASVEIPIHSAQLLNEKKYPLDCVHVVRGPQPLSEYLGIEAWLKRLVPEGENAFTALGTPDKAAFTAEIAIKYDAGNAGATYTLSKWTGGVTLFGSHATDETVTIAFTPDPKKVKVQTLPDSTLSKSTSANPVSAVSPAAALRLDQIQTDVRIGNIRVVNP